MMQKAKCYAHCFLPLLGTFLCVGGRMGVCSRSLMRMLVGLLVCSCLSFRL
jgi:hypothetical protein